MELSINNFPILFALLFLYCWPTWMVTPGFQPSRDAVPANSLSPHLAH